MFPVGNPQLPGIFQAGIVSLDFEFEFNDGGFIVTGDESETGFGVHAGLNFAPSPEVNLYGQIGYLSVDELDGPEFKVGVKIKANEQSSLSADYRASRFEIDDIRLGAAIYF